MKMKMLEKLKNTMSDNELEVSNLTLQFCANKKNMESPSADYLPIMMHMCPPHFSTVDYFEVNSFCTSRSLMCQYISNNCVYLKCMKHFMYWVGTKVRSVF